MMNKYKIKQTEKFFLEDLIETSNLIERNDLDALIIESMLNNMTLENLLMEYKILDEKAVSKINMFKDGIITLKMEDFFNLFNLINLNEKIELIKQKKYFNNTNQDFLDSTIKKLDYPNIGDNIGEYKIQSLISNGANAKVYQSLYQKSGTVVTLKVFSPMTLEKTPYIRQKVIDGAINSAGLIHPNIIKILDADYNEKYTYIATEYVDGISLDKYLLKKGGKLSTTQSLKIIKDICLALKYAFEEDGIIHKNLKPQNIIITKTGEVKLTDFSTLKDGSFNENVDLNYISPEYFETSSIKTSYTSDMYSLGVILYNLITGILPIRGNTETQMIYNKTNSFPLPPEYMSKNIDKNLSNLIIKLLNKNPENRYKNYDYLIDSLDMLIKKYQEKKINILIRIFSITKSFFKTLNIKNNIFAENFTSFNLYR